MEQTRLMTLNLFFRSRKQIRNVAKRFPEKQTCCTMSLRPSFHHRRIHARIVSCALHSDPQVYPSGVIPRFHCVDTRRETCTCTAGMGVGTTAHTRGFTRAVPRLSCCALRTCFYAAAIHSTTNIMHCRSTSFLVISIHAGYCTILYDRDFSVCLKENMYFYVAGQGSRNSL